MFQKIAIFKNVKLFPGKHLLAFLVKFQALVSKFTKDGIYHEAFHETFLKLSEQLLLRTNASSCYEEEKLLKKRKTAGVIQRNYYPKNVARV